MLFLTRGLLITAVLAAACTLGGASAQTRPAGGGSTVEVVAELAGPARAQDAVWRRIHRAIPEARIHWRYRVVLNGLALVMPATDVDRLKTIAGVKTVYASVRYRASLDRSVPAVGAPSLWGPALETAGNGIKIGIIDDGIEVRHPFFSPAGYALPQGFPKGQTAFTTAKVIVARAFAPPSPQWRYATRPFDPQYSEHGTHVAGIAAGNYRTNAGGRLLSGVAPRAYLGNYKVLTIPTPEVGIDGNSPEIAAAIEAAVRDGMNVINLSIGEPEVEPTRDLVVKAIDGAAAAGVVPVVAAGNEFEEFGAGSISSPGSAPRAITVAASTDEREITTFSSGGPTPISLLMKPDLTAPGSQIVSSIPVSKGSWDAFSGTSMASPHVSGGAALLLQRHPTWNVRQIKSALALTGRPVTGRDGREVSAAREGGGFLNLVAADKPLVFANPTGLSFGLVDIALRKRPVGTDVNLTDAGGGAGVWSASLRLRGRHPGVRGGVTPSPVVPGRMGVKFAISRRAPQQDVTGFVVLTRGAEQRRIPLWFRVTRPQLRRERALRLRRPGVYRGNTRGKPARVRSYRYPSDPGGAELLGTLAGPEQIFRVVVRRRVANFGAVVLSTARGVRIEPRVVRAGDENRLQGQTALPLNNNPYVRAFFEPTPVVGAVLPKPGVYDVVFDTPSRRTAGRFSFRFWIDDHTPPAVRLVTRLVRRLGPVALRISDRGSGVDPRSITATLDGRLVRMRYFRRTGRAIVGGAFPPGRHTIAVQVSDYQEAKNMEDVPRILPNTRTFRTTFVVR
jgi:subtilisin family serine protease